MNTYVDDTPSNTRFYFSTSVLFKILITQHQDRLILRHMKKMICDPVKKKAMHQIYVGYMTHLMQNKHRTRIDQVIIFLYLAFKQVTVKSIKNEVTKNVSVILLVIIYENRKKMMYEVIGAVIYTIINNCICLDYLSLI